MQTAQGTGVRAYIVFETEGNSFMTFGLSVWFPKIKPQIDSYMKFILLSCSLSFLRPPEPAGCRALSHNSPLFTLLQTPAWGQRSACLHTESSLAPGTHRGWCHLRSISPVSAGSSVLLPAPTIPPLHPTTVSLPPLSKTLFPALQSCLSSCLRTS